MLQLHNQNLFYQENAGEVIMASRGINKVILIGYLGQDPEIRYMPNGGAIANITLATSESWRDKQTNELKEKTEWHRVVIFGKLAEIAGEYLKKGSQVYIEGSLQTRKWQDQSGQDRYTTEVVVNIGGTLQMLGGRGSEHAGMATGGNWGQPSQPQSVPTAKPVATPVKPQAMNEPPIDFDDDIPF